MLRLREQVYRAELGGAPAEAGEGGDVAGEGLGVAADVDDAARLHFVDCRDALRRTARAGRVKEHYIRVQALPCRGGHPFGGVGADKAGICNFVAAGVGGGVLHGGGVAFNTDDLFGQRCSAEANRADAAVSVNNRLAARQLGKLQRFLVQNLGLCAVDLVKAAGRNGKLRAAQRIQHKAGAVERFLAAAQHGAGAGGVDILHDANDPRRFFAQSRAEILAAGQVGAGRDQRNQHLIVAGAAQHGMAQKAGAAVLIVGGPAAGAGGVQHGGERLIQNFLLQKAVRAGQDAVGALGIQAADEFASLGGKAGNGLVAIVQRLGHALYGLDRGKPAQQLLHAGLFFGKLFTVGQRQQWAAAAFFLVIDTGVWHRKQPFSCTSLARRATMVIRANPKRRYLL